MYFGLGSRLCVSNYSCLQVVFERMVPCSNLVQTQSGATLSLSSLNECAIAGRGEVTHLHSKCVLRERAALMSMLPQRAMHSLNSGVDIRQNPFHFQCVKPLNGKW